VTQIKNRKARRIVPAGLVFIDNNVESDRRSVASNQLESNKATDRESPLFAELFLALVDSTGVAAEPGVQVLDVGTGIARIPIDICRQHHQIFVTAVDRSATLLARARRHIEEARLARRIDLQQATAASLPYRDGQFDAVISNGLIHHVADPAAALREMIRVLKPRGVLCVRDTLPQSDFGLIAAVLARPTTADSAAAPNKHQPAWRDSLNLDQARQLAQAAGLPLDWVATAGRRHWTIRGLLSTQSSRHTPCAVVITDRSALDLPCGRIPGR
jgi:2-polyprenyl-3-methyl-5-hydroxy-6-metoxy-1,4-benzoquinol methylase